MKYNKKYKSAFIYQHLNYQLPITDKDG